MPSSSLFVFLLTDFKERETEKVANLFKKSSLQSKTPFPSDIVFVIVQLIFRHEVPSVRLAFSLLYKAVVTGRMSPVLLQTSNKL